MKRRPSAPPPDPAPAPDRPPFRRLPVRARVLGAGVRVTVELAGIEHAFELPTAEALAADLATATNAGALLEGIAEMMTGESIDADPALGADSLEALADRLRRR